MTTQTIAERLQNVSLIPSSTRGEFTNFLDALQKRTIRIHTIDNRMFVGEFKATDNQCNIVLAYAHEYRKLKPKEGEEEGPVTTAGLQSRYVGMVVLPGHFITKIERDLPL